jgi:glycosyltransferase involved in cell wall biosynthesis
VISIISVFPPYRGGISTFSDYLYRSLKDITAVNAFNFSHLYPPVLFPGKTQFDPAKNNIDYADRVLHSWNFFKWKKAANDIIASKPDQILICYWHPFFAPLYLHLSRHIRKNSPNTTVNLLAHNVLPHEHFPFGKMLSKKLVDKVDKVILLSQKSLEEFKVLKSKTDVKVLFHPVYEQDFPQKSKQELRAVYGFTDSDYIPLFFGLIRPYKGLDLFIEALNKIDFNEYNIRPLIAGEFYTEKAPLLNKINTNDLSQYKIIDRFVSDKEMAELFTLSDVLVMPYKSATQSGILANAINFKLPSIVTNLSGLTEHVEHNKTALVVSKNNAIELSDAIISMTHQNIMDAIKKELPALKSELSWYNFSQRLLSEIT